MNVFSIFSIAGIIQTADEIGDTYHMRSSHSTSSGATGGLVGGSGGQHIASIAGIISVITAQKPELGDPFASASNSLHVSETFTSNPRSPSDVNSNIPTPSSTVTPSGKQIGHG